MRQFLDEICPAASVSPEALQLVLRHGWPGNVRELRSAVRAGALMAGRGRILPEHLPRSLSNVAPSHPSSLQRIAGEHILKMLESVGGNRSRAARLLGIDRGTLSRKLAALGRRKPAP
jgi:transcriptional regulator of acetoin/glycerol metabolism